MFFFFQAEDGIRALVRSRGLGDVYKRQVPTDAEAAGVDRLAAGGRSRRRAAGHRGAAVIELSLIHI